MCGINGKKIFYIAFSAAVVSCIIFAGYILNIPLESCNGILFWVKDSNIKFYFAMLVIFFAVFFGIRVVFLPIKMSENRQSRKIPLKKQGCVVAIFVTLIMAVFLQWFFIEAQTEFPGRAARCWQPLLLLPKMVAVSFAAFGIITALYMVVKKRDIPAFSLYLLYAFLLIIYFFSSLYVNVFKTDLHHGIAVLESIYNVCDLIPFSKETTGIYGHYSLFFWLPMFLSHGSQYMAAGLLALSGCIGAAATFYVSHTFLTKNWLRAMVACACTTEVAFLRGWHYWQINPVRVMFPMLLCAYVCFLAKNNKSVRQIRWTCMGYILGSLAVLWNTESGIFCLIAFSAYKIVEQLQLHQWYEREMLLLYISIIILCAASVVASIGIVNIYNLFCGGKIILRAFFFPLFTESYMDDTLRHDMPWGNHAWIYVFILFSAVLAWSIYQTRLFKKSKSVMSKDAPAGAAIAVLGLMSLSYYVNRAAYGNLFICYCEALCANALIIRKTWGALNNWQLNASMEDLGKKAVAIVSIITMTFLGMQVLLGPVRLTSVYHSDEIRSVKGIEEDISAIKERLPENTYGAGRGTSIIYHMLGWDHYAHVRDFSDLYVGGDDIVEMVVDELMEQDAFLLNSANAWIWARLFVRDSSFKLVDTFPVQGQNFYYCKRSAGEEKNWLKNFMTVPEESGKVTDQAIYINPQKLICGPYLYLKSGEYVLHVTASDQLNLQIYYHRGDDIILEQQLEAGVNQIRFSLPEEIHDLEFVMLNKGQKEVSVTELHVEIKE